MKVYDLTEAPVLIDKDDFDPSIDEYDLNDPEQNNLAFKKMSNSSKLGQLETLPHGRTLYVYGDKIVLLNNKLFTVDYYVKIEQGNFKRIGKYVTQVEVWRSPIASSSGIVKKVFFTHLMKNRDIITSDTLQTEDGRRLWINLVEYALDDNKFVYVYNMNDGGLIHIPDITSYSKTIHQWYGTDKKYEKVRILISNIELML